ncbi:MAG: hypothetical protein AABX23_01210 [Nanoarchaeota archaeon]
MVKKATGQDLVALRKAITSKLVEIANASDSIRESMSSQPHPGGNAFLIVKPYANPYGSVSLTDSTKGSMHVEYQNEKGDLYSINITIRKEKDRKDQ